MRRENVHPAVEHVGGRVGGECTGNQRILSECGERERQRQLAAAAAKDRNKNVVKIDGVSQDIKPPIAVAERPAPPTVEEDEVKNAAKSKDWRSVSFTGMFLRD